MSTTEAIYSQGTVELTSSVITCRFVNKCRYSQHHSVPFRPDTVPISDSIPAYVAPLSAAKPLLIRSIRFSSLIVSGITPKMLLLFVEPVRLTQTMLREGLLFQFYYQCKSNVPVAAHLRYIWAEKYFKK